MPAVRPQYGPTLPALARRRLGLPAPVTVGLVALAALALAPLTGYAALRTREELDRFIAGTRAVLFFVTERRFFRRLLEERRRIRREILALGDEAERAETRQG